MQLKRHGREMEVKDFEGNFIEHIRVRVMLDENDTGKKRGNQETTTFSHLSKRTSRSTTRE